MGQKPRSFYGRTQSEAIAKLREAIAERQGGLTFDARRQTLAEYLDRWLNDSVRGSVSQRTYDDYAYAVR
jgi:integrase